MRFTELGLAGAFVIDIEPQRDERGFLARTFCAREYEEHGLATSFAQCSTSFNRRRGTLRGMHYQISPYEEAKVVRCTAGTILDVIVDVRAISPTLGQWRSIELAASDRRMLYIPPGIAHGFQTLEDDTEVYYQITTEYVPAAARGIRWNDPRLAIDWPIQENLVISPRDASFPNMVV